MSWCAARLWTCGVFVAALFWGGCASQPPVQTQAPGVGEVAQTPVQANRARIERLQARQQAQPGYDAGLALLGAFEDARAIGDREGAGFAASLLINSGSGELDLQGLLQDLGQAVVDGLELSDASMQQSMRAALTTVCARGLRFEGACQSVRAFAEVDPEIVGVWVEQGYRHLLMEDFEKAEAVVEELRATLSEDFVAEHGLRAADILFLDAALLGVVAVEGDSTAHLERAGEAVSLVKESLEAGAYAEHLFRLSEQFRMRGLDWLASVVLQQYVGEVDDVGEKAVRTVQYARLLHEAGRWSELLELRVEGVDSAEWSTLELYRSDAAYQLGDRKLAVKLEDRALKAGSVYSSEAIFGLMSLVIQVNARRGDWAGAWGIGGSALSIAQDKTNQFSTEVRASLAGLLGARAEVLAMLGKYDQARQLFGESLAIFAELPVQASASVRVNVLEAWGRTAQGGEQGAHQIGDAIDQLALFRTQLHHVFEPVADRDARVALIRLALLSGSIEQAHEQFVELTQAGLSSGASWTANLCLRGKIGFYRFDEVEDQASVLQDLRSCAETGLQREVRAEAQWLASLLAPGADVAARLASTRTYQKTLRRVQARELERLKFFVELASKRQESADDSVRSGIAFLIADLRPIEAQAELVRVLRDNPELDEAMRMELEFLRLQIFVLLGQWHEASYVAADCAAFAAEHKDRRRLARVRALVKRFSL